jgi:very-short-patch-repair endonuclease
MRSTRQTFLEWIKARHGVAHSSDARAAGYSSHEISAAVASGHVSRIRRSWLVTPDCDSRRQSATTVGGRLTCVSAAALRGLWTPTHEQTHVAVPATSSRLITAGLTVHWGTGPAPVGRNANEDPLLNVLFHVARCLPPTDALAVWESAIRKAQTEPDVLTRVAWRSARATAIVSVVSVLSDSGLESHFIHGLRRAGVPVRQQVRIDGHRVDGLIGESLVVQIDGFAHHRAKDRRRDIEADARLIARGYTVLRFDYFQILFQWDAVLETIQLAMAQGAHLRRPVQNR